MGSCVMGREGYSAFDYYFSFAVFEAQKVAMYISSPPCISAMAKFMWESINMTRRMGLEFSGISR